MSECLRNLNCAKVQLQMSEPLKPIIVTPLDEKAKESEEGEAKTGFNYLYLLMPVQMR
jgi:DNA polymerase III sliding clamp (beta) subunit (PCNA family)